MGQRPPDDRAAGIDFGPLAIGDLAGISDLITRMSSGRGEQRLRDKSPAYYRWMYLDNPAGDAIVYSARRDGKVVSSFAVAPKLVQIDGRRITLGKTMDMFTDPDYQGIGLIKRCTEAVFRDARAAGMDGWYVTPSVNSYPIFTGKWGYREGFHLVYRARILDYSSVLGVLVGRLGIGKIVGGALDAVRRLRPRRPLRLPVGWDAKEVAAFDARADRLWDEVGGGYRVAMIRNADYLNWRYVRNPDAYTLIELTHGSHLVGILVVTTTVRRSLLVGEIVDFVCGADDSHSFGLLIGLALERFRELGCALGEAWSIPGTPLDTRLRSAGLSMARSEVKFLISPDFPDPVIYQPDAWLLTQGDGNDV